MALKVLSSKDSDKTITLSLVASTVVLSGLIFNLIVLAFGSSGTVNVMAKLEEKTLLIFDTVNVGVVVSASVIFIAKKLTCV
jgi:hypothetical protein